MKMTTYDLKQLQTRKAMTEDEPEKPRRPKPGAGCTVTPEERQKRHELLMRALEGCESMTDLATRLGAGRANVSKWVNGKVPVPQKHLDQLEEIAWRHHE